MGTAAMVLPMRKTLRTIVITAVNRRAIVSVAVGLGLALGGCSPSAPTPEQGRPENLDLLKPGALVGVTVSSVSKATIEPEKFSYTVRLKLTEYGGVPSTVTMVELASDNGYGDHVKITGDELGQNRRLMANGTLDLELTYVPAWGYHVGNEVFDVDVEVNLTDDDGNSVFAAAAIDKF